MQSALLRMQHLTSGSSLSVAHIDSAACSPDSKHTICTIYTQHMMDSGSKTKQEPLESGVSQKLFGVQPCLGPHDDSC